MNLWGCLNRPWKILRDPSGSPEIRNRKAAQRERSWAGISRGRRGGYPGGHPDPKKLLPHRSERRTFVFCADVLDPKAQTSMTRGGLRKTLCRKTSDWSFVPKRASFSELALSPLVRFPLQVLRSADICDSYQGRQTTASKCIQIALLRLQDRRSTVALDPQEISESAPESALESALS